MSTKLQLKLKNNLKTLTQGLLLGGVLTGFAGQSLAAQGFGGPQYVTVESYAKKMLAAPLQTKNDSDPLKKNDGRSALIILPWEIDDRGETQELDAQGNPTGQTVKVGKGGLVAVRLVDEKATAQTKTLTFEAPQYLRFGDSTSSCGSCEWENDVAVGDMDGNGFNDIVVLNAFQKTVTIFYNNGQGKFDQNNKKEIVVGHAENTTDHPFALAIMDYNKDSRPDLAVKYLLESDESDYSTFTEILAANGKGGFTWLNRPSWGGIGPRGNYGTPYYVGTPNTFHQLLVRPMGQGFADQLVLRKSIYEINVWGLDDQDTTKSQLFIAQKFLFGFLGLARSPFANLGKPADLLVSRGGGLIHDLVDGSALAGTEIPNFNGEAFIAGDFDLDDKEDFATVLVADRETQALGDLRVGFGDLSKLNAFQTANQYTGTQEAILPWKGNTLQMVAGNFFGKVKNGKVYQDIAVLGNDVVTVWPNANESKCDLGSVGLDSVNPTTVKPGDKITLNGNLRLGTRDSITAVTLTQANTIIPITKITTVMAPNVASVEIPANAISGDYNLSVKNGCYPSQTVQLTIKPLNGGEATLTGITPASALYGKTVTLNGINLGDSGITAVRIEGTGAAAGVVWNATKGAGAGQYQVVSPTTLQLQLPSYLLAQRAGVNLVEGDYIVSVVQGGAQRGLVKLALAVDKPIISQLNPSTANLGGTVQINGQGLREVSQIILTDKKAPMQQTVFMTGTWPGSFSFNGSNIVFVLPVAAFPVGTYDVQLQSPKGLSVIDPNSVLTIN